MTKKSITSAYAHPKKSDDDKTVEDNSTIMKNLHKKADSGGFEPPRAKHS